MSQLLRRVARGLRYRTLPDLVKQNVTINGLHTVEQDLRQALSRLILSEFSLTENSNPVSIVKRGIIEVSLQMPSNVLASQYQTGISLLRELGFIVEPREAASSKDPNDLFADAFLHCLEILAQDIAEQKSYLQLYLVGQPVWKHLDLNFRDWRKIKVNDLSWQAQYFPQTFIITDACYTNSTFVWFIKDRYGIV